MVNPETDITHLQHREITIHLQSRHDEDSIPLLGEGERGMQIEQPVLGYVKFLKIHIR